ncbi:MAG: hypothetical protein JRI23_05465, partial [Deltaproteobacteria bacterium]|nr:hypothetical protein [Deltaproteobacteria bacterium]MBW2531001.1 hypothetical protein [Deltaproteobacteria bacterium]
SVSVWARAAPALGQRAVQQSAAAAAALPPGTPARVAADGYVAALQEAVAWWASDESAA